MENNHPQFIPAEIIFGNSSRSCDGQGICRVLAANRVKALPKVLSNRHVRGFLSWNRQSGEIRCYLLAGGAWEEEQLNDGTISIESTPYLSLLVSQRLGVSREARIHLGTFPLQRRGSFWQLDLPLEGVKNKHFTTPAAFTAKAVGR